MLPYFNHVFGNASSRQHRFGWQADEAVERARQQVAALIGARAKEIVFTSGATEANNLAIRGAVAARRARGNHVVTVATEHHAVLDTCQRARARRLPGDGAAGGARRPGRSGSLRRGAHRPDGARLGDGRQQRDRRASSRLPALAQACRARGVWLHTDAVQAVGQVPFDVESMRRGPGVDHRAQDVRPEGRRRALRAALTAGRDRAALHRRRPGARPPSRDAERARHRRARRGGRAVPPASWPARGRGWRRCAIACWRRCRPASRRSP